MACKSREIEAACRKPSCVFPDICDNLGTDHGPLVQLYKKARAGELMHFTGIDSPYEPPLAPDIHVDTTRAGAEELAERIVARLRDGGYMGTH